MTTTRTAALPRRGKSTWIRVLVPLLTIVLAVGVLALTGVLPQVRRLIPGLGQPPPSYQTTTVRRGDITVGVTATGPIAAVNSIPLTFKTSGKLAELKVGVGDHVKAGQVLAVLDPTDLQTALNQAKSNLDQAKANDAKVEAGPTAAQRDVAQASLNSTKDSAVNAQTTVTTTLTSVADDIVTAQSSVHTAQLSVASAQHALATAQTQQAQGIAADQTAIDTDQQNLTSVKASVAANQPILLEGVEKAKSSLWSAQVTRDNTCSRSKGSDCVAANINVSGAETSLNTASDQVKQGIIQGQQQIATAQTTLDQAKTQLANDTSKLAAAIVSAQDQVNQATATMQNARTGVVQAQHKAAATVSSAEAQSNQAADSVTSAAASYRQSVQAPDPADVTVARAQVTNAQSAVDTAQANLDAAELTSPADATVSAINGSVGQFVSGGPVAVGDSALFTLIDLNNLKVTANVNEADIGQVKLGNPVSFSVSAFPNKTFTGKVVAIQPQGTVTQNVVNYAVTCAINASSDAELLPGMTAIATIIANQQTNVLRVPNTALDFGQNAFRQGLLGGPTSRPTRGANGNAPTNQTGGSPTGGQAVPRGTPGPNGPNGSNGQGAANRGVILTMSGGKLAPVRVTLGITDGTDTQIVDGLTEGESIAVGLANGSSAATTTTRQGGAGGGPGGGGFPFAGPGR